MKSSLPSQKVGIIGLGAIAYLFSKQLETIPETNAVHTIFLGKPTHKMAYQKLFKSKKSTFTDSIDQFISQLPSIIIVAIPQPIYELMDLLASRIGKEKQYRPTILLIQNGIITPDLLMPVKTKLTLVRGSVLTAVKKTNGSYFYDPTITRIGLASMDSTTVDDKLVEILRNAHIQTEVFNDFQGLQWSKLVYPNLTGLSTFITLKPIEKIHLNSELFSFEVNAFKERVVVTEKLGIHLVNLSGFPTKNVSIMVKFFPKIILTLLKSRISNAYCRERSNIMPATARRVLEHQTKIEGSYYLTPLIHGGREAKIPTPYHSTVYSILEKQIAKTIDLNSMSQRERIQLLFNELERQSASQSV